ncbi:MAG: glycoside hydrolase family 97 protein [bacterium]|nr:glycoside hydrolase family 97 protein [bacterium]
MKKLASSLLAIISLITFTACTAPEALQTSVLSPDQSIKVEVFTSESGEFGYKVSKGDITVVDKSYISFDFKDMPALGSNLSIETIDITKSSEEWEMPWGEQRVVKNEYNQLYATLKEKADPGRTFNVVFKVYDDGLGFRYEFPAQDGMNEVVILDENTSFNLSGDHIVWWIPGDWDIYEHLYNNTNFSNINAIAKRDHPNLAQTTIPENAVNTPVTMKTEEGLYLSFHEANLTNYSGMTLKVDTVNLNMVSELVGSRDASKVKTQVPFNTPWRTIQIAERAGDLVESNLIVNLNEPNKLGDVSWFKPMKYMGIWWEMHMNKSSWDLASGKHGATTENAKRYIDFAAKNNIKGLLVEGWNTGWERWIGFPDREGVFDFVTPYEDYDIQEVVRYGKENGVDLIMHHETSAAPRTYDQQMDTAYQLMHSLDIHSVKTGYVGPIIPDGEYHHGQWMVNHYRRALETAAKYNIAINAHEPIKGTGIRRTYPNAISREGLRGQEFNAWSIEGGNPPNHLPNVVFTRMLAGPIDFTPGIFDIKFSKYKDKNQVNTTLAQQLALYVVLYSPIQMAADFPENYEGQPAFQFIREVGVDWEQSKVLDGEPGEFAVIAREERDTKSWFVGGISDESGMTYNLNLDFLEDGITYEASIYKDGEDAHWDDNPLSISIESSTFKKGDKLELVMAPGGGFAISLIPQK